MSDILPFIKLDTSLDLLATRIDQGAEESLVVKNLNNGLLVSYLQSNGDDFVYLENAFLETMSSSEIHAKSLSDLAEYSKGNINIQKEDDVCSVILDGSFEASLILIDELWDNIFTKHIEENYIICVPARDTLVFCDVGNEKGKIKLRSIIAEHQDDAHFLSNKLFIRSDGSWVESIF